MPWDTELFVQDQVLWCQQEKCLGAPSIEMHVREPGGNPLISFKMSFALFCLHTIFSQDLTVTLGRCCPKGSDSQTFGLSTTLLSNLVKTLCFVWVDYISKHLLH